MTCVYRHYTNAINLEQLLKSKSYISPFTGLDRPRRFLGNYISQISLKRHRMVVGCQLYAPAAFTPSKYSWYSFLLEAESTPEP